MLDMSLDGIKERKGFGKAVELADLYYSLRRIGRPSLNRDTSIV